MRNSYFQTSLSKQMEQLTGGDLPLISTVAHNR